MNKLVLLSLIPLLFITQSVYAGGPRGDSPEDATPEEGECWLNGYDDGFAGIYDEERGRECEKIGSDYYDWLWNIGCEEAGIYSKECEDIRD